MLITGEDAHRSLRWATGSNGNAVRQFCSPPYKEWKLVGGTGQVHATISQPEWDPDKRPMPNQIDVILQQVSRIHSSRKEKMDFKADGENIAWPRFLFPSSFPGQICWNPVYTNFAILCFFAQFWLLSHSLALPILGNNFQNGTDDDKPVQIDLLSLIPFKYREIRHVFLRWGGIGWIIHEEFPKDRFDVVHRSAHNHRHSAILQQPFHLWLNWKNKAKMIIMIGNGASQKSKIKTAHDIILDSGTGALR